MRTKDEILNELKIHSERCDPQHKELALVAIIETEVQLDIRNVLYSMMDSDQLAYFNRSEKL